MATFIGTANPESITGTIDDDLISGMEGNDLLLHPAKNKAIQTKLNEVEEEACPGVIEGRTRPLKTP